LKKSASALPELAEDISTSVQIQADRLSANARSNWDETLDRLREAIAAGVDASLRETQVVKQQNAQEESDSLSQHLDS
jgi:gas vesicle protein